MDDQNSEKKKVLVVDDDPFYLRYLSRCFNLSVYEVVTASDGKEALERALSLRPDLIVLDLDMPDLDGIETCKMLKAAEVTRQIPVVILTATKNLDLNQRAFNAGAHVTVLKSMSRMRLMNILEIAVLGKNIDPAPEVSET